MQHGAYEAGTRLELERDEGTNEQEQTDRGERGIYRSISSGRADIHHARASNGQITLSPRRRNQPANTNNDTKDLNAKPLVVSSKDFIQSFVPPDYLIDGLIQRRFLYSLTGNTGAGKTAIALRLGAHVALGEPLGDYEIEKGRALSELHWQGKFRGPEFEPISFELHLIEAKKLTDSKGRPIRTVLALPLSEEDRAALEARQDQDGNFILTLMSSKPGLSLMDMAKALAWKNAKGQPDKRRIQKGVERLRRSKRAAFDTNTKRYKLTENGKHAAMGLKSEDTQSMTGTVPAGQ